MFEHIIKLYSVKYSKFPAVRNMVHFQTTQLEHMIGNNQTVLMALKINALLKCKTCLCVIFSWIILSSITSNWKCIRFTEWKTSWNWIMSWTQLHNRKYIPVDNRNKYTEMQMCRCAVYTERSWWLRTLTVELLANNMIVHTNYLVILCRIVNNEAFIIK